MSKAIELTAEEAVARLTWALEGLSGAVGVELDPVATSGLVRGALEGKATVSTAALFPLLRTCLERARLVPADAAPPGGTLATTELPLLDVGGGLAVLSRRGLTSRSRGPASPASGARPRPPTSCWPPARGPGSPRRRRRRSRSSPTTPRPSRGSAR